jgi:A-macroglobulin TED domain
VDQNIISGTRRWLLEQASPNGTWAQKDSKGQSTDWSLTYYTTYLVQILSRDLLRTDHADKKEIETQRALVAKGIEYLSKSIAADIDPYRIALLALAKLSIKQDVSLEIAALLANEHTEEETIFWNLQQNTLFYGWGFAGRLETTALVLEALTIAKQQGSAGPSLDRAFSLGTHFLLKNKDRYHVWYSTQSTVNVLQCLVRQLSADPAHSSAQNSPAAILVDGRPGPELPLSKDARQLTPQRVDLTAYLGAGAHKVEIRGGAFHQASAYLNATYYLPWNDPSVAQSLVPTGDSESIRYSVKFDRTAAATGDKIQCTVHAERVGFRGYGMMLAEVGLPGAGPSRAMKCSRIVSFSISGPAQAAPHSLLR